MLHNTLTTIKLFRAGQVLSNPPNLNPIHLSLATTAYSIQSQTLSIPDRIGLFSAGPLRLQVHEAESFIYAVLILLFAMIGFVCILLWCWALGIPNIGLLFAGYMVSVAVCMWGIAYSSQGKRAPGYVWEDWKDRKHDWEEKASGTASGHGRYI